MAFELTASQYIKKYMGSVHGWISVSDAKIFAALLELQVMYAISGAVVEIGVHHGRSFILLALARRGSERALAIDLFEDDELNINTPGRNRRSQFFKNCARFDLSGIEAVKSCSLALTPEAIRSQVGGVRFFSIDGGHQFGEVHHDITLAYESIIPEGIVAIDDFCNRAWPEVTFASFEFLRHHARMVPFLITDGKLYCSMRGSEELYRNHIKERFPNSIERSISVLGHETLLFRRAILERGLQVVRNFAEG
jgi:hypothetical protein